MLSRLIKPAILLLCLSLGGFFYIFTTDWFDFSKLDNYQPGKPSIVYDTNGVEITRFQLDKRSYITYDKLPGILIDAFIAAEDHRFFSHGGISIKGVLRSFLVNLYHRRFVQGASTITQQLIRLLFLSCDRKIERKLKETFLALALERKLTKEQILELYINNIYFGRGIYGVEAACRRFWNKSAQNVTIQEAAVLAAVAKSARFYSPLNAPLTAKKRRNTILKSMLNMGFINQREFEEARIASLELKDLIPGNPIRLYIQEWVRTWAENQWGRDVLYKQGLKIKTTIDTTIQEKAENAFTPVIHSLREEQGGSLNGGMISIEVSTGKIRAMVAGLDFNESQFNRTFQAVRQAGSSFKPIVYAAALQKGYSFDMVDVDEPMELNTGASDTYQPRNWNRKFEGQMTLLRALTTSNNIITIKTFLEVGANSVIKLAKKFGIYRELWPYPSLALGIAETTVEENAAAFNVFANNGYHVKPFLIESVKDQWGKKIWTCDPTRTKVLDPVTNSKMASALSVFMDRRKMFWPDGYSLDSEATGKSGSTNDSATNWYVGSTPELTTAVYVGRDDNKGMGRYVFSSQTAYPIWFNFHKNIDCKDKSFYAEPSLNEELVDWISGETVSSISSTDVVRILK